MIRTNYLVIAIISILFLGISLLHLCENDVFSSRTIKRFRNLIVFIMAEIIVDTIFEVLSENLNVPKYVLYLVKEIEFSMNPILTLLTLELFNNNNEKKNGIEKIRKTLLVLSVINIILQMVSFFNHFMFYIDDKHLYQRSNVTIVYAIFLLICAFLLVIAIKLYSTNTQNIMKKTLFGFFAIFVIGFTLRFIFPRTNFDWLCISVSVFILLIFYSNATLKLDALTRLLNRQVYQRTIEKLNWTTLIIMIDANNFKQINDTYGHECGDKTLKVLARSILKAYGAYAYCFRLGGDEFAVILKEGVFEELIDKTKYADAYAMTESLMAKLDKIILELSNNDDNYLKYGVSQGYGIYKRYDTLRYPNIKDTMSLQSVIKLADKRMYQMKQEFKKKYAENPSLPMKDYIEEKYTRLKVKYEPSNPELIEGSDKE